MSTNNSIPEQLVNLLEWFAGCLDMNLSPADNASKFIRELPDDPKAQSLISSLLHPSPVNEDWKEVETDILDILIRLNGNGSGAHEVTEYFKALSQNVPSQGYSLEQVEKIAFEYADEFRNAAMNDEALTFQKWSQTDQGKELLKPSNT